MHAFSQKFLLLFFLTIFLLPYSLKQVFGSSSQIFVGWHTVHKEIVFAQHSSLVFVKLCELEILTLHTTGALTRKNLVLKFLFFYSIPLSMLSLKLPLQPNLPFHS